MPTRPEVGPVWTQRITCVSANPAQRMTRSITSGRVGVLASKRPGLLDVFR